MVKKPHPHDAEILRESAARIVASGTLGSGRVLPKLFEYLVERALNGEVPKEFDIATDLFGKDPRYREAGDAQIRVWIYRLRSGLDRYYSGAGKCDSFRIQIPKGTYSVETTRREADDDSSPRTARRGRTFAGGALALVSVLSVAGWAFFEYSNTMIERPLVSNSIWAAVAESELPIIIVVGDHFFFGEPDSPIRIRDIRINSEEELRHSTEFRSNPELVYETLSYLPKSAVFAMPEILPRVGASSPNYALKLASELTPDDLRVADIVFIGFIRSMGVLRDYYLTRSNFTLEPPYLDIVHAETEDVFTRSGPLPQSNTDHGLFARFTGPTGNQILVFSGIGDVGVLATTHALNTAEGIREVEELIESNGLDDSDDWEALLEVDGHSRTDFDFRVLGLFPMGKRAKHDDDRSNLNAAR